MKPVTLLWLTLGTIKNQQAGGLSSPALKVYLETMKEKKRKIDIFNLPDDMTASEMKEAEAQFKECRALVN